MFNVTHLKLISLASWLHVAAARADIGALES